MKVLSYISLLVGIALLGCVYFFNIINTAGYVLTCISLAFCVGCILMNKKMRQLFGFLLENFI